MPDAAYAATRRKGKRATVVRLLSTVADPETGARDMQTELYNIRLVVKEQTSYGRVIKAKAVQQDVGFTTFIFWTRDVTFIRLDVEDYIIMDGLKHQVVNSVVEDTSLVVTANEIVGAVPKQVLEALAAQSLSLNDGTAEA